MSNLFLRLLNISITAGWIVLVVVLLRFVLKKAPKWTRVALWGLVALRLLVPVSIESVLSLIPSAETVQVETVRIEPVSVPSVSASLPSAPRTGERIVIRSGFEALNSAVNPPVEKTAEHVDTVAVVKTVAGWVWLSGAALMLLYAAVSYLRLRHRVRASVKVETGVYVCDEISDPFILGVIRPKIYLSSGMDETTRGYVLAHERAHLKRLDHVWKPIGFLLLAIYWFNPLLWLAYVLLCRDIELACDEKVIASLDDPGKALYSKALLNVSVSRRSIAACPLAFGEVGVKSRVKSILNYKKPAFWIILVAILAGIVVAVCFLTVPKKEKAEAEPEATAAPLDDPEPVPVSDGEVLQWLDYYSASDQMPWEGSKVIAIDAFPNVNFRWTSGSVEAKENGTTRTLFTGMPIWNVFFADVTGDGKPELCASVSFGSGFVDEHIVVYDYANLQSYTLWDRFHFDYHLYTVDGKLLVGKTLCNSYSSDTSILDTGTLTMQDGLLCCQWHSDGAFTSLNRELHESELFGEWLVVEETDNNGNVLYSNTLDLWKEYNFREDGTVVYNETVPVSSDSELAFGHPVSYPYEVHNNYVYIAGDDTSGAFRWGSYDRDTRTLTLMYSTDGGTVYAKLKRMGEGITDAPQSEASPDPSPSAAALHESDLYGGWLVREERDGDGNVLFSFDQLGLWKEYDFLPDGTVRCNEHELFSSDEYANRVYYPFTVQDGKLRIENGRSAFGSIDAQTGDLILCYQSAAGKDVYATLTRWKGTPETGHLVTQAQADAFVNGLSVEFEDGSPYGCDLVVFIDGFGRCLNVGDANAAKHASLRFEVFDKHAESVIYTKYLNIGGHEYYLGDFAVLAYGNRLYYNDQGWDTHGRRHSSEEASIFVTTDPSLVERNWGVTERACVIKAFDAENRTVTVSYVSFEEPKDGYPAEILYDTVEDEEVTLLVTDDTFLSVILWYDNLVKPDRFFRYLEENRYYLNGVDTGDGDDRGIGFWIGLDGDTLLYLCEVYEE